jgi:hypothetical protein
MMIERVVCYRPSFVGSLMVWDLLLSHRPMRRSRRHGIALGRGKKKEEEGFACI